MELSCTQEAGSFQRSYEIFQDKKPDFLRPKKKHKQIKSPMIIMTF